MRVAAERATAQYSDDSGKKAFVMPSTPLTNQYANLYFTRLGELRPVVEATVRRQWGEAALSQRVKTLDAEEGTSVLVIGTLYKVWKGWRRGGASTSRHVYLSTHRCHLCPAAIPVPLLSLCRIAAVAPCCAYA